MEQTTTAGRRRTALAPALRGAVLAAGRAPEVGRDAWCAKTGATSKADRGADAAAADAGRCVLGLKPRRQP